MSDRISIRSRLRQTLAATAALITLAPPVAAMGGDASVVKDKLEKIKQGTTVVRLSPDLLDSAFRQVDQDKPIEEQGKQIAEKLTKVFALAAREQGLPLIRISALSNAILKEPLVMRGLITIAASNGAFPYVLSVDNTEQPASILIAPPPEEAEREHNRYQFNLAQAAGMPFLTGKIDKDAAYLWMVTMNLHEYGHIKDPALKDVKKGEELPRNERTKFRRQLEIAADNSFVKNAPYFLNETATIKAMDQLLEVRFLNAMNGILHEEGENYVIAYELAKETAEAGSTYGASVNFMPFDRARKAYNGLSAIVHQALLDNPELQEARDKDRTDIRPFIQALEIAQKAGEIRHPDQKQVVADTLKAYERFTSRYSAEEIKTSKRTPQKTGLSL